MYTIQISNGSHEPVQLLNRSWTITNATGHVERVAGPGVVGEQPVISPGQTYEYSSGCPLGTPFGSMVGTYQMASAQGELFDVAIPAFALRMAGTSN